MKLLIVVAIDSWHLANGIHCPSMKEYHVDDAKSYKSAVESILSEYYSEDAKIFGNKRDDSRYYEFEEYPGREGSVLVFDKSLIS